MAAKQRGRVVKVRSGGGGGSGVYIVTLVPEALAAAGIEAGEYVVAVVDAKRKGVIELHRVRAGSGGSSSNAGSSGSSSNTSSGDEA